jgi:N-acetylglucosaminyl-diphospho-decaprenol L-rhamnosyltransferase
VDNASSDGTADFVRAHFPAVEVMESGCNLGFSAGNNIALRECRGNYVVLLNPDTEMHRGALGALMRALENDPGAGAAGPKLLLADGTVQPECARPLPRISNLLPWLLLLDKLRWRLTGRRAGGAAGGGPPRGKLLDGFNLLFWSRDRSCRVEYICGACMVIRREVMEQIGLLDEASPMFLDDMDYCRRMGDAGWSIRYAAEARVTHLWQQSSGKFRREADFYALVCHSMWLYFRKHEGRGTAAVFAAMVGAAGLLRVAVCGAALAMARGRARDGCRRQWEMALGLCRWALRVEKRAPRFGFAGESSEAARAGVAASRV